MLRDHGVSVDVIRHHVQGGQSQTTRERAASVQSGLDSPLHGFVPKQACESELASCDGAGPGWDLNPRSRGPQPPMLTKLHHQGHEVRQAARPSLSRSPRFQAQNTSKRRAPPSSTCHRCSQSRHDAVCQTGRARHAQILSGRGWRNHSRLRTSRSLESGVLGLAPSNHKNQDHGQDE